MYHHIPVLLQQAITILDPKPGQSFVDATLGGGGYTNELLKLSQPEGKVLAIDLDEQAIENYRSQNLDMVASKRVILCHGNFQNIDSLVRKNEINQIHGIVADIGLSSFQLDQSGRGITFQKKEPLDMRFDISKNTQTDAKFLLNFKSEAELAEIFSIYGEEKHAVKIAKNVVRIRVEKPLHYTTDLLEVIQSSLPKPVAYKWKDSARRIFQALRIAVNHELSNLTEFLPKAFDLVEPGGKIVIVSFHSLEDRIVKQFFKGLIDGCVCPPDFPICKCGFTAKAKLVNRKIITAQKQELESNPRSQSAKLRAIEKL